MIRRAQLSDINGIIQLAIDAELFKAEETSFLVEILESVIEGKSGDGHQAWVNLSEHNNSITGAIYFGPDAMVHQKWDVWMIVVAPKTQRKGVGSVLLNHAEKIATSEKARLIVVETSSLSRFQKAGNFYKRCGYSHVARIPDYYSEGEDKLVYLKKFHY